MKINFNMSAIIASNELNKSDDKLSQALERLSSGLKINHAKDNPAGLAMSKRMHAQIRGLERSNQNASDGISVIETAEGALSEIQEMTQRISELTVKAANGTMSDTDRTSIQEEVDQLVTEIERIGSETQFNGKSLLDGTFSFKAYSDVLGVKVQTCSEQVPEQDFMISSIDCFDALGNPLDPPSVVLEQDGSADAFPTSATVSYVGNTAVIEASDEFEMKIDLDPDVIGVGGLTNVTITSTGIGAMRLQIGANEGQVLELDIPAVNAFNLGLQDISVATQADANTAIDASTYASTVISEMRSRLGAYQNRLEHTISSLAITSENMTAAYSRIMDVDMATEMTEYTTQQVLTQAGTSMLAQANERPQQVLQLLQ